MTKFGRFKKIIAATLAIVMTLSCTTAQGYAALFEGVTALVQAVAYSGEPIVLLGSETFDYVSSYVIDDIDDYTPVIDSDYIPDEIHTLSLTLSNGSYYLYTAADFVTLANYSYWNDTDGMSFTISSENAIVISSTFDDGNGATLTFRGIGSAEHPFTGSVTNVYSSTILLNGCPALFKYLSSSASLTGIYVQCGNVVVSQKAQILSLKSVSSIESVSSDITQVEETVSEDATRESVDTVENTVEETQEETQEETSETQEQEVTSGTETDETLSDSQSTQQSSEAEISLCAANPVTYDLTGSDGTYYCSQGGLAQVLVAETSEFSLSNVSVNGNIENSISSSLDSGKLSDAGGLFGRIECANTINSFAMTFTNVSVNLDEVQAYNDGDCGYYIGRVIGNVDFPLPARDVRTTSCVVTAYGGNAGGMVGSIDGEFAIISTSALNLELDTVVTAYAGNAGLLAGMLYESAAFKIGVDNLIGLSYSLSDAELDYGVNAYYYKTTDAGGNSGMLVGKMSDSSSFEAGAVTVEEAVVNAGIAAGGAFGYVDKADISFTSLDIQAGTIIGAISNGGYIGEYLVSSGTGDITVVDDSVSVGTQSKLNIYSSYSTVAYDSGYSGTYSTQVGGLFGLLTLASGAPVCILDFSGTSATNVNANFYGVGATNGNNNIGGLVGSIDSQDIENTVRILGMSNAANPVVDSLFKASKCYTYGGVVGTISATTYLECDGVFAKSQTVVSTSALYVGGFLGYVYDGAILKSTDSKIESFISQSNTETAESLFVGATGVGCVLKLCGSLSFVGSTTAISTNINNSRNGKYHGIIVGRQNNSLIYADSDWSLTRDYKSNNIIDYIGNYGQVIKNNNIGNLITLNADHTVTLLEKNFDNNTITFADIDDVASYAITMNTRGYFSCVENIDETNYQNLLVKDITFSADISLADTGIECLLRSDSETDQYSGVVDGAGFTVTLAIGERYGCETNSSVVSGIVSHKYVGLFSYVGAATVSDITFAGILKFARLSNVTVANDTFVYAGALAGKLSGNAIVENVTNNVAITLKNTGKESYVGGLIGNYIGSALTMTGCTSNITASVSVLNVNTTSDYFGGMVGYIQADDGAVLDFSNTTLSQSITKPTGTNNYINMRVGGLVSQIVSTTTSGFTPEKIAHVNLSNLNITNQTISVGAKDNCGGHLGYSWKYVDVSISGSISGDVTVEGTGNFGGLVNTIEGRMKLDASTSVSGTYSGQSTSSTSDGLIVCNGTNLYLVIGNNFSLANATITNNGTNTADLLVGNNIVERNKNGGIVTIETGAANAGELPSSGSTWYSAPKNPNARYYYNVECLDIDNTTIGDVCRTDVMTEKNIKNTNDMILWNILNYTTGLSNVFNAPAYYFRKTTTAYSQNTSYGIIDNVDMTGLCFYPTTVYTGTYNFYGNTLKIDGTAPALTTNADCTNVKSQNYMMHTGLFMDAYSLGVKNLVLEGIAQDWSGGSGALVTGCVYGGDEDTSGSLTLSSITLKELEIDSSATYKPVLINTISSCLSASISGIYQDYATDSTIDTAGSSLIGNVGSETADRLNFTMNNIVLDGLASTSKFTTATLFNNINYILGNSSFSYNFYLSEDWSSTSSHTPKDVTYGYELTEAETTYFDSDAVNGKLKVNPDTYPTEALYDFTTSYLPYVAGNIKIDVNKKSGDLLEGFGTYQNPYIVKTSGQLYAVYQFISDPTKVQNGWQVNIPDGSGDGAMHTASTYTTYTWANTEFAASEPIIRPWLRQAYYKIESDINLSGETSFNGIGTQDYPFYGAIIGGTNPTPVITMPSALNVSNMGLVNVAQGCVVKDINVNYSGTCTLATTKDSYFGGILGNVVGGDNIIDNVTLQGIASGDGTQLITSNRRAYVGGYIGFVTSGGVTLRNMDKEGAEIYDESSSVISDDSSTYFYANPYVGRVNDGYVIAEADSNGNTYNLDNTDKNYTIACIDTAQYDTTANKISLSLANSIYTISLDTAEQMYILSNAINSGSMSVGSNTAYTSPVRSRQTDYSDLETTDPLNSDYINSLIDAVAMSSTGDSYLVARYFDGAANQAVLSKCRIELANDATYDLTDYGNGFRGFGGRFATTPKLILANNGTNYALAGNGSTVTVNMDYPEYSNDTYLATSVALINKYNNSNETTFNDLTISGISKLYFCDSSTGSLYNTYSDMTYNAAGLVGAHTSSNSKNVKFINIDADSLTVKSQGAAGGIIGYSTGITYFTDCTVNSAEITGKKGVGGLAGVVYKNLYITASQDVTLSDLKITFDGVGITTSSDTDEYGAGGLVGITKTNTNIQQNLDSVITISDIEMYVSYEFNKDLYVRLGLGGVIGRNMGTLKLNKVTVSNIVILANKNSATSSLNLNTSSYAYLDDYVDAYDIDRTTAMFIYRNLDYNTVKSDTRSAGAGGLIGSSSGATNITNCDVNSQYGPVVILCNNNAGGFIGDYRIESTLQVSNSSFNVQGAYPTLVLGGNRASGIIAFANKAAITLTNVSVGNADSLTQIYAPSPYGSSGSLTAYAAGFVAQTPKSVTISGTNNAITNCTIYGYVCGAVTNVTGVLNAQNISLDNCDIYANQYAGGLVEDLKSVTNVNGFEAKNSYFCAFDSGYVGAIAGNMNSTLKLVSALWQDNSLGYSSTASDTRAVLLAELAGDENPTLDEFVFGQNAGEWFGKTATEASITMYAVSRSDSNEYAYDYTSTGGTSSKAIVYGDYGAEAASEILLNPYLTLTPFGANKTIYGDGVIAGKAHDLLYYDDNGTDTLRPWWYGYGTTQLSSYDSNYKKVSDYDTTLTDTTLANLPIFVVNGSTDTMMKEYVNTLTNGGFAEWTANSKSLTVSSALCTLVGNQLLVDSNTSGSVVYDSSTSAFKKGAQYDNLKDDGGTFTLLTMTYTDTVLSKSVGYTVNAIVYYPQVLTIETNLVPIDYEEYNLTEFRIPNRTRSINIAHEGTYSMYIEYTYNEVCREDTDWNFDKVISSKNDLNTGYGTVFPSGTVIKLVDLNSLTSDGYREYSYTVNTATASISINDIITPENADGIVPLASLPTLNSYNHIGSNLSTKPDQYGLERYLTVVTLGASDAEKSIYHIYGDVVASHNVTVLNAVTPQPATVTVWRAPQVTTAISSVDGLTTISQNSSVHAKLDVDVTFVDGYVASMVDKTRFGVIQYNLQNSTNSPVNIPAGTIVSVCDAQGNVLEQEKLSQNISKGVYEIDGNLLNMTYPISYSIMLDFSDVSTDDLQTNFTDSQYALKVEFFMTSNANYPQSGISSSNLLTLIYENEYGPRVVVSTDNNTLCYGVNMMDELDSTNNGYIEFNVLSDFNNCSSAQLAAIKASGSTAKYKFKLYKKNSADSYVAVENDDYLMSLKCGDSDVVDYTYDIKSQIDAMGSDNSVTGGFAIQIYTNKNEYSNYMLVVTLEAKNADNADIFTSMDHFIYTVAKINTNIIN